jgi:hypothetical protein
LKRIESVFLILTGKVRERSICNEGISSNAEQNAEHNAKQINQKYIKIHSLGQSQMARGGIEGMHYRHQFYPDGSIAPRVWALQRAKHRSEVGPRDQGT